MTRWKQKLNEKFNNEQTRKLKESATQKRTGISPSAEQTRSPSGPEASQEAQGIGHEAKFWKRVFGEESLKERREGRMKDA